MTTEPNKFRFDDSTGQVYQLNNAGDAYEFIGTYLESGIKSSMKDATKIRLTEEMLDKESFNAE